MRAKRTAQISLFDPQALDHPVADELEWASAWLDAHPELLDRIAADLDGGAGSSLGRHGLTRETVLRCAVLMHLRGESYRGLAFALVDSLSAQRFARLDPARRPPGKSVLQAAVGAVGAASWEAINRTLLEMACASGVETGDRVRIDSTVTETHILEPSDSRLLFDGVRVLTRLLGQARDELGAAAVDFHDHCRAAKRRALEAGSQRGAERRAKILPEAVEADRTDGGLRRGGVTGGGGGGGALEPGLGRDRDGLSRIAGPGDGADRTAGVRRRDGAGGREGGEPVRAAHGHSRAAAAAGRITGHKIWPRDAAGWCSTWWWRTATRRTARALTDARAAHRALRRGAVAGRLRGGYASRENLKAPRRWASSMSCSTRNAA